MKKIYFQLMLAVFLTPAIYAGTYSGGSGTSGDPYQIATTDDLIELSNTSGDWSAFFIQTADIDFGADETLVDWDGDGTADWDAGDQLGFSPIGNNTTTFTGNYNGDGHKIDHLFINRLTQDYVGFFGYTYPDPYTNSITKLALTNVDITGQQRVGSLAGSNAHTVNLCYATGTVFGTGQNYIGGFVGYFGWYTLENCYSMVNVSYNSSSYSQNKGAFCGGTSSYATVRKCYSTGSVYYIGGANPEDLGFAGVIGYQVSAYDNYFDSDVSNQSTGYGATAKTTDEMKTQATFTDWDFTTIWTIDGTNNSGYPYLSWQTFEPVTITWDGSESSDWNTAGNWDKDAVPTINDNVIITTDGSAAVISGGGNGASCNELTINSGATLNIEDGGSLIANTSTGTVTVERELNGMQQYHFLSSPINNADLADIFPASLQNSIFLRSYDEPSGNWVNLEIPANLTNGIGYSYYLESGASAATATFSGNLITSDQTPNLTNDGSGNVNYNGYNLLGNPFASAIQWGTGSWNLNNVADEVHVWDNGSYKSYAGGVGALTDGIIPAQQGFFVKANGPSPSLSIPADARTHSTQNFYKESITNVLRLDITNNINNYTDAAFIRFAQNATNDYDNGLDAHKLSNAAEAPMLYTKSEDLDLSINALPLDKDDQEIFIYFSAGVDGIYTINARGMESFENPCIILYDLKTNSTQNLTEIPGYSFEASTQDNPKRFKLGFETTGLEKPSDEAFSLFASNDKLYVACPEISSGRIIIYNTTGQMIKTVKTKGSRSMEIAAPDATGVYLVTLETDKAVYTRKVYIK